MRCATPWCDATRQLPRARTLFFARCVLAAVGRAVPTRRAWLSAHWYTSFRIAVMRETCFASAISYATRIRKEYVSRTPVYNGKQ